MKRRNKVAQKPSETELVEFTQLTSGFGCPVEKKTRTNIKLFSGGLRNKLKLKFSPFRTTTNDFDTNGYHKSATVFLKEATDFENKDPLSTPKAFPHRVLKIDKKLMNLEENPDYFTEEAKLNKNPFTKHSSSENLVSLGSQSHRMKTIEYTVLKKSLSKYLGREALVISVK